MIVSVSELGTVYSDTLTGCLAVGMASERSTPVHHIPCNHCKGLADNGETEYGEFPDFANAEVHLHDGGSDKGDSELLRGRDEGYRRREEQERGSDS